MSDKIHTPSAIPANLPSQQSPATPPAEQLSNGANIVKASSPANSITSAKKQAARRTLRLAIPKLQQQHAAATESMQFAKQRNDVTKLIQNERKVNSARLGRMLHSDGSTGSGNCSDLNSAEAGKSGPPTNSSLPDTSSGFTFLNRSPEVTAKGKSYLQYLTILLAVLTLLCV